MSRLRSEAGFTLTELLVASFAGIVVLLAALAIMDRAFVVTKEATDRTDAQQRGRLAMDLMVQQLRSQVCLGGATSAITAGTPTSVTFIADLGSGIERRTLTYDPTAGAITEYDYVGTGTYPNYTYPATPTRTKTLLTSVVTTSSTPVFSYYAFDPNSGTGGVLPLTTPLSATDLGRVVRIGLAFTARPQGANNDRRGIPLQDDVFVRASDPTNPTQGLSCL
jgi:Tfp pilus assembly protein PilW